MTVLLADVLDEVQSAVYNEAYVPEWDDSELAELWERRRGLDTAMQAARRLRDLADREISVKLDGGSARFDDYLVRATRRRTTVIMEPDRFWDWLGEDARYAFRPNAVRLTSLRAIAEKRGQNPRTVVNSLIDYEYGEDQLQLLPINRAPQYAQVMEPGEVRRAT